MVGEVPSYLMAMGKYESVPWLRIDRDHTGKKKLPWISGHEGRHRSRAMTKRGNKKALVSLFPGYSIREDMPRRHREDYIQAMREELMKNANMVLPEQNSAGTLKRPAIKLPETFKNGGLNG